MDKVIHPLTVLLERYMLPLLLVAAFLLYRKFSWLFDNTKEKKEEAQREADSAEHENALVPDYTTPAPGASDEVKRRIAQQNAEKARLYKQASMAERFRSVMGPSLTPWFRTRDYMRLAEQMKARKISLSGVAVQYKKLTGDDFLKDMRFALGDDYLKFIGIAGTTK
jgi:hypothetical protein